MSQRFFAVNVLSHSDRVNAGKSMKVIRCRHHHSIDVLLLIEHPPKVRVAFGFWKLLEDAGGMRRIDVTKGDDVFILKLCNIVAALSPKPDPGKIELLIGRRGSLQTENFAWKNLEGGGPYAGADQKAAAIDGSAFYGVHDTVHDGFDDLCQNIMQRVRCRLAFFSLNRDQSGKSFRKQNGFYE